MKTWKHLTIEQRKIISNGISHNYKLKEIAETLGFDSKFKENPAFNEILENYIRWFQNANSIAVQKEESKIIFNWNSNDSTKHSMIISSYQPQVLNCITLDKKETLDGLATTEKIAQEIQQALMIMVILH